MWSESYLKLIPLFWLVTLFSCISLQLHILLTSSKDSDLVTKKSPHPKSWNWNHLYLFMIKLFLQ